jgi:hypothetical protein
MYSSGFVDKIEEGMKQTFVVIHCRPKHGNGLRAEAHTRARGPVSPFS